MVKIGKERGNVVLRRKQLRCGKYKQEGVSTIDKYSKGERKGCCEGNSKVLVKARKKAPSQEAMKRKEREILEARETIKMLIRPKERCVHKWQRKERRWERVR